MPSLYLLIVIPLRLSWVLINLITSSYHWPLLTVHSTQLFSIEVFLEYLQSAAPYVIHNRVLRPLCTPSDSLHHSPAPPPPQTEGKHTHGWGIKTRDYYEFIFYIRQLLSRMLIKCVRVLVRMRGSSPWRGRHFRIPNQTILYQYGGVNFGEEL